MVNSYPWYTQAAIDTTAQSTYRCFHLYVGPIRCLAWLASAAGLAVAFGSAAALGGQVMDVWGRESRAVVIVY